VEGRFALEFGVRTEMGLNYFYRAVASILDPVTYLA